MPASNISRITHSGSIAGTEWARKLCGELAEKAAKEYCVELIKAGKLPQNVIEARFKEYYRAEYYRLMASYEQAHQAPRPVDLLQTHDGSATKFLRRHTVVNFSRLNCLIHVHRHCITVGRVNFPMDSDESPETKEAFVTAWPGPLDKVDNIDQMKRRIIKHIESLQQHCKLRRIKYCDSANDDRRVKILELLRELIQQNGFIDAAAITKLLIGSQKTLINNEDSNRKPIETIQKYLLLADRTGAIKFARTRKLFDHAQCLAFLDKYQPPNADKYTRDSRNLKDDSIVLLNDDYINTAVDNPVLNTVYRSLLNRILETDPESMKIIRRPNVMNNDYEFAILSANDCEMDFDQSNELFKLIRASKRVLLTPEETFQHLIALGLTYIERSPFDAELRDDMSNQSHLSSRSRDPYAPRTLTISNVDLMMLNEIWEYCLNLASGTCDPSRYRYVTNLIPYKLVLASRLFDFGLHDMFAHYIRSIRDSLEQARNQGYMHGDAFYDWTTIERSFDHLRDLWMIFQYSPERLPHHEGMNPEPLDGLNAPLQPIQDYYPAPPSGLAHSFPAVEQLQPQQTQHDLPVYNDYPRYDLDIDPVEEPVQEPDLLPPQQYQQQHHQHHSLQPQQQPPVAPQQQYTNQDSYAGQPFDMQPLANQLNSLPDMSRYQRPDYPDSSQLMREHDHNAMKSSSPVNKNRESMGDSFPFSPIQDNPEPQSTNSSRRESAVPNDLPPRNDRMTQPNTNQASTSVNNSNNSKSHPSGDQQNNFLSSLVGKATSFLPKSNSKPMILPDDKHKDYVEDNGRWVNRSDPNGELEDEAIGAPPILNTTGPTQYSFTKSSRSRYPAPSFK